MRTTTTRTCKPAKKRHTAKKKKRLSPAAGSLPPLKRDLGFRSDGKSI